MRLVVIPAGESTDWRLPPAQERELPWVPGGHRSLYGMAVAAASLGHDVEIRGTYQRALHEIAEGGGGKPRLGAESRVPRAEDVILVPEGGVGPVLLSRILLSPARPVIALLAPPNLFGPRVLPGFRQHDPLTIDPNDVGRPEHFRSLRDAGFELLTNSREMERRARGAGVDCAFVATGQPLPLPELKERAHDAAFLASNRWAPLAREVAGRVGGSILEISEGSWSDVIGQMASARILILPIIVEGRSSIQIEARAVGTIPVALRSNAFYEGLEEGGGVLVDSLDEMPRAIERLLGRPEELAERSEHAMESARRQMDWSPFVEHLAAFLSADPPADPLRPARALVGEAVAEAFEESEGLRRMVGELRRGVAWQRDVITRTEQERDRHGEEIDALRGEVAVARRERDDAIRMEERLRSRRSVRVAVGLANRLRRKRVRRGDHPPEARR